MAQRIDFSSGSYYVGNPIIYRVVADTPNGICVFHRVVLEVTASLYGGSAQNYLIATTVNKMSQPVESGGMASIDISSALRSVLDNYQYKAEPPTYPLRIVYTLRAWDEFMIGGSTYEEHGIVSHTGATVYPGRLSDRERLVIQTAHPDAIIYVPSTKPTTTPEIVCAGHTYVRPYKDDTHRKPPFPIGMVNVTDQSVLEGRYVLPSTTKDCYEMRIVNRFGYHEYVCMHSLRSAEVKYDVKNSIVARQETLLNISRGVSRKLNDRETWKISTYPLDQAWQQWFLHEFMIAEDSWIKIDGLWLQVHILPEETVKAIDRVKADALTVDFSLQFDITGSPFEM